MGGRPYGLLVPILALCLPGALADPGVPGLAEFSYRGDAAYAGWFDGACQARFIRAAGQEARATHDGGEIYLLETRAAVFAEPRPFPARQEAGTGQDVTRLALAGGHLQLGWAAPDARLLVLPHRPLMAPGGDSRTDPFLVRFASPHVDLLAASTAAAVPEQFWKASTLPGGQIFGLAPLALVGTFDRTTDIGDGAVQAAGDVTLYVRHAQIRAQDAEVRMAPYEQRHADVPGAAYEATYTEAFIHLRGVRLLLEGVQQLQCGQVRGQHEGTFVADRAEGTLRILDQALPFEKSRVALEGRFHVIDDYPVSGRGAQGRAEGEFRSAAIDHALLAVAPSDIALPSATLWTLLGALAAAAAWRILPAGYALYTRIIGPAVLAHPRRAMLAELIRTHSGLSLTELGQKAGLQMGVLRHHLKILHAAGLVAYLRHGRCLRLLAPAQGDVGSPGRVLAGRDARYRRLLEHLAAGPLPQSHLERALAADLGLTQRGARKILAQAEQHHLVRRQRGPAGVTVCAARTL
jgi:DNA-binding transcriptional ArsR family regulator